MPTLFSAARTIVLIATVTASAAAFSAGRHFPEDSYQVSLQKLNEPNITIDGTSVHLAPGLVIFSQTNNTIVRSALPVGAALRVQFDGSGDVRRIWVLNDDEVIPVSWWHATFGGSFTPPVHNAPSIPPQ